MLRGEYEDVNDLRADHVAERSEDRDAEGERDRDRQHSDEDRFQNARHVFDKELFAVMSEERDEQCRQKSAAGIYDRNRQTEHVNVAAALDICHEARINERARHRHRVKRRRARFFCRAVRNEQRHETERDVRRHAQQVVRLRRLERFVRRGFEQQEDFEHAARDQIRDQRRVRRFCSSASARFVEDSRRLAVNGDQILPENDLKLVAVEHHARYRLRLLDLCGVDFGFVANEGMCRRTQSMR